MQDEIYTDMARLQDGHWWFSARRSILGALIRALNLPAESEILEIGCGTGANLAMLAQFGRLHALESHADARALAAALQICPVSEGALPDHLPGIDRHFDLVCLLDVLEHIEDDVAALVRCGQLLKPGGRLLISVPAYAWLWSAHDDLHQHRRRYTAKLLAQKVALAGLQLQRVGYFNTLLFPCIALVRLVSGLAGRRASSDAAMPGRRLNGFLKKLFGLERHLVPRHFFPFGTSVLAVVGKRA